MGCCQSHWHSLCCAKYGGHRVGRYTANLRASAKSLTEEDLFHGKKYQVALELIRGVDDGDGSRLEQELVADALVLAKAILKFQGQLAEDVFMSAHHEAACSCCSCVVYFDDWRTGDFTERWAGDLRCVLLFRSIQEGPARKMCESVARCVAGVLGSGGGSATPMAALVAAARAIPNKDDGGATQDVPSVLEGWPSHGWMSHVGGHMDDDMWDRGDFPPVFSKSQPWSFLAHADLAEVRAAANILGSEDAPNDVEATHFISDSALWSVGGWGRMLGADGSANSWTIIDSFCGLDLLYARCVNVSAPFHEAMDLLFEGIQGCTVIHAMMKKYVRARAKIKDPDEYRDRSNPWSHLKDVLRVSSRFETVDALIAGYKKLLSVYEAVAVKSRLAESTHDVLVNVRFMGVLVEVQLHLGIVLDVKALSHAAYNITRADATDIGTLFMQGLVGFPDNKEERAQGVEGVTTSLIKFATLK